jgi:NADPH-dependent 2,4-dienoyl-CoA reductase/sulfur reductase-like enzyme
MESRFWTHHWWFRYEAPKDPEKMKTDLRINSHPVLTIHRGNRISFQYNGKSIPAYEGETIAAALFASGLRIFSRSFKYHRPRGLFCLYGRCAHCLMRVDGVPNVRTCVTPACPGMHVQSQNAWPSLLFDMAAVSGYLDFLIRPGFQYRRFIRPRWAYHIWEKFLRRMAGIGTLADVENPVPSRRRVAAPAIAVVGAGVAGLSSALHAAETGAEVMLIEKEDALGGRGRYDTSEMQTPDDFTSIRRYEYAAALARQVEQLDNCRVLKNATAFAWYDEGVLAVSRPGEFWELKPGRVIIASGSYETPMVFENNDLPGIFTAGGLQRLMNGYQIRPGLRAVVVTPNDEGYDMARQLSDAGVRVTGIVDTRPEIDVLSAAGTHDLEKTGIPLYANYALKRAHGHRHISGITAAPADPARSRRPGKTIRLSCDTLCVVGARTPANELLFQRTCKGVYVLESPHQFTRKAATSSDMHVEADMFVAGGAGGTHGAGPAWLEGKIAGLSAALDLGYGEGEKAAARDAAIRLLAEVRG